LRVRRGIDGGLNIQPEPALWRLRNRQPVRSCGELIGRQCDPIKFQALQVERITVEHERRRRPAPVGAQHQGRPDLARRGMK